jgi:hypothetical protein
VSPNPSRHDEPYIDRDDQQLRAGKPSAFLGGVEESPRS